MKNFQHTLMLLVAFIGAGCGGNTSEEPTLSLCNQETSISDNFEAYQEGGQSVGDWQDISALTLGTTAPFPSFQLVSANDVSGGTTKAIQFHRGVTTSSGLYKKVESCDLYKFSADVLINEWSNASITSFTEWAVALGLFNVSPGVDLNGGPQMTFIAQPVAENWVLYLLHTTSSGPKVFNQPFAAKAEVNIWYRVSTEINARTGNVKLNVVEIASNTTILDESLVIPEWDANTSATYDHAGLWNGHYNTDATQGSLVTIDNLEFSTQVAN